MNTNTTIFISAFFVLLPILSGCSSDKYQVSGTVKFPDGLPLTVGTVIMEMDSFLARGAIKPDGTFSMGLLKDGQGIPTGTYRVAIQDVQTDQSTYLVDENYMNPMRSGITFQVENQKQNHFDITVEQPKKRQ